MKIKCPKCGSIFEIDENMLPNESKFRCYKCGFMWIMNVDKFKSQSQLVSQNTQLQNKPASTKYADKFSPFRPQNSFWFYVITLSVLFAAVSFVLISNRDSVVRGLKKLSLPGISSTGFRQVSKTDLEIEIEKPVQSIKRENKDLLLIKGRVINATNKKQFIPIILIELKNKEKVILSHINKKLDKEYIAANSSENFTFIVDRYSKTIVSVEVNFDLKSK